jgi:mRNA-degrading endonuclease RelE of RelBE toxin-antitoxin system
VVTSLITVELSGHRGSVGRSETGGTPAGIRGGRLVEVIFGPLAENPHRVGAALLPPFEGQWRARRGEYRVRYTIDDDHQEVLVLDVDHRRDAYRRP